MPPYAQVKPAYRMDFADYDRSETGIAVATVYTSARSGESPPPSLPVEVLRAKGIGPNNDDLPRDAQGARVSEAPVFAQLKLTSAPCVHPPPIQSVHSIVTSIR